jgi:RimJ/RimL family protein N-acetyltransferase
MRKTDVTGGPGGARLERTAPRHYAALRDGFNSGSSAKTSRWHLPRSIADVARSYDGRRYAIVADERVIGTCGLHDGMFAGLELVIAIFDPRYRGHGIGTFAVRSLCDVAFGELRSHRVELGVYADNLAGIRTYRRCGFVKEAVLRKMMYHEGRWRDLVWMSLLRAEGAEAKRRAAATAYSRTS